MTEVSEVLTQFAPISLDEMDGVQLLNRTDTKFIFNSAQLPAVLENLSSNYRVLQIDGRREFAYRSLYFDTEAFQFFLWHQAGKRNRYKLRQRKYLDSGLTFLEIKFKNNKGRTIKSRTRISDFEPVLSEASKTFIKESSTIDPETLRPTLWNAFTRVTLVHNDLTERLTIDHALAYEFDGNDLLVDNLVIAELKQDRTSGSSAFAREMRDQRIKASSMSKYCVGCVLLHRDLKYNAFKEKLLTINKITDGAYW